jgi:hypothetical protein
MSIKIFSIIRNISTDLVCNISDENKLIKSNVPYEIYSSGERHTFFGYYDKTPFNYNSDKILANSVNCENLPISTLNPYPPLKVGYFEIGNSSNFIQIGETKTWCWQQGARLMWFPKENGEFIIYNDYIKGKFSSVVYNISSKKVERF